MGLHRNRIVNVWIATLLVLAPVAQGSEPLLEAARWRVFDTFNETPNLYINDIISNISNELWIASDRVVGVHDGTVFTPHTIESLPADVRYQKLLYDVVGTVWLGTSSGLMRFVAHQWRTMLEGGDVTAIVEASDGTIWAGVSEPSSIAPAERDVAHGIYRYNGSTWTHFGAADGLPTGRIRCLYGDANDGVWAVFGTDTQMDALYRYDGTQWRDMIRELQPPTGTILAISQTSDGAYWFGTYGRGVWRWDGRVWETFRAEADLATFTATALLSMPDGTLWAAGAPAGTLWSWDGRTWVSYPLRDVGISGRRVTQMIYAFDDAFWFVIPGSGLARFDRRGGPWWTIGKREGFPSDAATSVIREGVNHTLWFGTTAGLVRIDNTEVASPPELSQLTDQEISALLPMPDGSIWVAGGSPVSRRGIWQLSEGVWSRVVTTPELDDDATITAMFRASNGDIWIGTRERQSANGCGVFVNRSGEWAHYT